MLGLIGAIVFLFLMTVGYSHLQERREKNLAKRLEQNRDPNAAMAEIDKLSQQSRSETRFFRWIYSWFTPFYWWK
jgi:hypothetical protein